MQPAEDNCRRGSGAGPCCCIALLSCMLMSNDVSKPKSPHPDHAAAPATLPWIYMEISSSKSINPVGLLRKREKGGGGGGNPSRWLVCACFKELAPHQQPKLNGVKTLIILPQLSSHLMLTESQLAVKLKAPLLRYAGY